MTSVIPASPSPQLQIVLKLVEGYNKWDVDTITADVSDDWQHHVLPRSLGIPVKNKVEWRAYFASIRPWLKDFTVRPFYAFMFGL